MTAITPVQFRFDAPSHTYTDLATGEELQHITGLLRQGGYTDEDWYEDEHRERGQAVHALTADYDLGALVNVAQCDSKYRGWLLAHQKAMMVLDARLTIHAVEEPLVHSRFRYGGRPDRVVTFDGRMGVVDIKSGHEDWRAHGIQTALQAILVSETCGIPPEFLGRWLLYLKPNGKFKFIEAPVRRDFDDALDLIRRFC